jgi:hypothetical protein
MTEQTNDTVEMNDLDDFVHHLVAWHQNRVAQLNQLLDAPDEVEIRFETENTGEVLTGEGRKGFMAGLVVAKDLLGELPFTLSVEEPEEAEAQA